MNVSRPENLEELAEENEALENISELVRNPKFFSEGIG